MKRVAFTLVAIAALTALVTGSAVAQHAHSSAAAKVQVRKGKLGHFLVDGKGFTLYLFEKDKHGKSSCSGTCAKVWSPLTTSGKPSAGPGVTASKLGTTKRGDGRLQVTYAGHPLYHYDDDHKPGQTEGQGSKAFGADWYVVAPSGKKIDES
jgi:predicted lipoprotein with Yx(FWY)xxD motif